MPPRPRRHPSAAAAVAVAVAVASESSAADRGGAMATPCLCLVRFPAQQFKAQGPKLLGSIKSGYVQGCGGPTTLLHAGPTCPSLLRLENSPHPRAQHPPNPPPPPPPPLSLRGGSRNPLPLAAVRLLLLTTTTPSEPQLISGYLRFLGVMPLPATPAHGAVHLPCHTGVTMDTSAEAIFVRPSPSVTADIEESLRDYTSVMERWTKEHVLAAHVLRSKVAPNRMEAMRLAIAATSHGSTCFLDAFDECIQPVDLHLVTQKNSFKEFLGSPLQQTVPNTCAIVSSTKCVEVQHRREYETLHGTGSFPCNAAAPRKLRRTCFCQKMWKPKEGAYVGDVIEMIQKLGGARTTSAPAPAPYLLPVRSWQQHRWDVGGGLTADHITELLDSRRPFVGTIWVCPWYDLFNSVEDEDLVYRSGCARNKMLQQWSVYCFGKNLAGFHSVLCFEYRVCDGQLHVLILDNHEATGPQRWIHHSELEEVHTITVERISYLGDRHHIRYPHSGVS